MSVRVAFDPFAVSLGISLVPVDQASKRPRHKDWTDPAHTFSADAFRPEDNHGGRWGAPSGGLIDIDCDTAEACRLGAHAIRVGPSWGRRSKRGSHYVVRCAGVKTTQFVDPLTKRTIIEIRSTGSQSVLPPSRHPSGELYEWERQAAPPEVESAELVEQISELAAAAFVGSLWSAGSRHGFALALAGFLAKSRVPLERAQRFVSFVTVASADDEGPARLRDVADTYDAYGRGDDIVASFHDVLGAERSAVVAKALANWLRLERDRYQLQSEGQLLSRSAAPFLVKSALVRGALCALVSPPDVGKTFLMLDLLVCTAAFLATWLGLPLLHGGPVVYVMGEGAGRFKLRYLAAKQRHGVTRPLPFHWIDQPVPLLDEKATAAFTRQVAALKPVVIVFDTLSRCLMGGDENSQADMGKAMAACDELRARTGALVMLLHHTGKSGTQERGSSVLRASVDTVLFLEEDEDERGSLTLRCDRQKDAEPFEPIALMRQVVQLDDVFDDEGNPETSCVIRVVGETGSAARPSKEEKRDARIVRWVAEHPDCTKSAVCEAIGGRRKATWAAVDDLLNSGRLRLAKGERLRVADMLPAVEL